MRSLLLPAAAVAAALLWLRRDLVVRAIRELDRRGGLASNRAERAYAGLARLFAPLHERCLSDTVAFTVAASGSRTGMGGGTGAGMTILDIGAGPGDVVAAIREVVPAATILAVEPSAAMRSLAAERAIDEIDGTAEHLPVADGSVDLAISTLSMHHWADPAGAFRELRRVLRPGGTARIYDVRFAAYGRAEVSRFATGAGLDSSRIERDVLSERLLGLRPYVRITVHATPQQEEPIHAG